MNENMLWIGISVIIKVKSIITSLKLQCKHQLCWKKGKNQIKTKHSNKIDDCIVFNEDLQLNSKLQLDLESQTFL